MSRSRALVFVLLANVAAFAAACAPAGRAPDQTGTPGSGASTPEAGNPRASAAAALSASPALPVFAANEPLVLFNQLTGAGGGIFVSRPDGSALQELATDVPGIHKRGSWSPDGQKVVLIDETTERMYIAHLDGTATERVPACDQPGCDYPSWSPDGMRIAFSRSEGSAAVGPAAVSVNVVDLASGKVTTVSKLDRPFLADVPRWSPDGTRIVFGIDRMDDDANETGGAIAVVSVSGGEPRVLTDYERFFYAPDWSWTTDRIVFSVESRGSMKNFDPAGETWDLWIIDPDGAGLRQLTHAQPGERLQSPRWSPDGTRITAYDHRIPGGIVVDATTGSILPFVTTGNFTRPTIRPLP